MFQKADLQMSDLEDRKNRIRKRLKEFLPKKTKPLFIKQEKNNIVLFHIVQAEEIDLNNLMAKIGALLKNENIDLNVSKIFQKHMLQNKIDVSLLENDLILGIFGVLERRNKKGFI